MAEDPSGHDSARIDSQKSSDGVLRVGAARAVLMTESAFVFLQRVLHENMPELSRYGFYEMGYRAGLDLSKAFEPALSTSEAAFRAAVRAYQQAGYGRIEVVHFDIAKPEARLIGHDLLEAAAARHAGIHRSPRCVDHYSRGMLAGLFSRVLGKQVICEELRCEYRGDDACEFVILGYAPSQ